MWSTGATTQDITVNPTSTTTYSVTIKADGVARHVVVFTVNVIDAPAPSAAVTMAAAAQRWRRGSHHPCRCNHNHNSNSNCNGGNHNHGCNTQHKGQSQQQLQPPRPRSLLQHHPRHQPRLRRRSHLRLHGNHSTNQTCQSRGGHRYNCSGNQPTATTATAN
ncbi:MAG: hypothetical protein U0176_03050 [Bacteroidia bacterium]